MTDLEPVFGRGHPRGKYVNRMAWRIGHKFGGKWTFRDLERDLAFGRKADCERAINALEQAGIVDKETMEHLSDHELGRLCCKDLAW